MIALKDTKGLTVYVNPMYVHSISATSFDKDTTYINMGTYTVKVQGTVDDVAHTLESKMKNSVGQNPIEIFGRH